MEFRTVVRNFVPDLATESTPDAETRARWQRLQEAGINTAPSGAEKYISLRTEWDAYITSLAPTFNYDLDEIDTALAKVK